MGRTLSRSTRRIIVLAALIAAAGTTTADPAKPATYKLLPESSTLKQASVPGYLKTEALCAVCHSRDYITTQPSGKGQEFWTAEVNKMVTVYGAPIPEPDRALIAQYLGATY